MPRPPSKFHQSRYRRNLPHIQAAGRPHFVTFTSFQRWTLPEQVRGKILEHCLHDHAIKLTLRCAIVMPDHIHLIFWTRHDPAGVPYSLEEIMNGIKGASAHSINRLLHRRGHVWQDESFDHVIRSSESLTNLVSYVRQNPVRKGFVKSPDEWPWYWAEPGPSNFVPRRECPPDPPIEHG